MAVLVPLFNLTRLCAVLWLNAVATASHVAELQIHFSVDISDWYEQKVQAEAMYISQGHTLARARQSIELTSGHTGRYSGTKYAESFVREQQELLPHIIVTPSALKRAESPIV